MTEITFYRNEHEEYTGFRCDGHAGFADEGEDIVCAAISALVTNTINSVLEFTNDTPDIDEDEEEGYIDVSFFDTPGEDTQLLLRSLVLGLSNIEAEKDYSDYIQVMFEEV